MKKEGPIISKWHKKGEELRDEKIGGGFVSEEVGKKMGVRLKEFETKDGKRFYVYKEVMDRHEAKEVLSIYKTLQEAGLPVVEFAKVIKKRVVGDEFVLAMEDLTENNRYEIISLDSSFRLKYYPPRSSLAIEQTRLPEEFREQMVKALAIMHNLGIYDYHPGLSFVLRLKEEEDEEAEEIALDFKIIDYANLKFSEEINPEKFNKECREDLKTLLFGIIFEPGQEDYLCSLYDNLRSSGIRQYEKHARTSGD